MLPDSSNEGGGLTSTCQVLLFVSQTGARGTMWGGILRELWFEEEESVPRSGKLGEFIYKFFEINKHGLLKSRL